MAKFLLVVLCVQCLLVMMLLLMYYLMQFFGCLHIFSFVNGLLVIKSIANSDAVVFLRNQKCKVLSKFEKKQTFSKQDV